MTIFDISADEIKSLSDIQLIELLEKLLLGEVKDGKFSIADIHVSHNKNASDGGVDGTLKTENQWIYEGFIKNNKIVFQIKATSMSQGECEKEINKDSSEDARSKIEEGFHYIVFCNKDDCTEKMMSERINGMRTGLSAQNIKYDEKQIHFYDITKIRNWVNSSNPAIKLWVKQQNGKPAPANIFSFSDWGERSGFNSESEKFFLSENLTNEMKNIGSEILSTSKKFLRIVGHSGIGKTRRVYESIKLLPSDLQNKVTYCQIEDSRESLLLDFVNASSEQDFILIVDDCSAGLYDSLKRNLKSEKCKLKLVAIDYEIPELDRDVFLLEDLEKLDESNKNNKVIESIIKHRFGETLGINISRVVEFAQGYPFLAIKLAEALADNSTSAGELSDDELKRKLLWGREVPNDKGEKENFLSICSLFTNLGFDDELVSQSKSVCASLGLNFDDFHEVVKFFRARHKRIIQSRGRYIFVVPLPLAAHLASKWFERTAPDKIKKLITDPNISNEVRDHFCQQMKFLSDNEDVIKVVGDLCGIEGPFGNAEVLNSDMGSRYFCAFVEVAPEKMLGTVEQIFDKITVEDLRNNWGPGRRNLIWALEKLVFRKETFHGAIRILYKFALAENETWGNNATGQFCHLFHLVLSGTEVPAIERLFIIDEAIKSNNTEECLLALKALDGAFSTSGSRSSGAEYQGRKKALVDWYPTQIEAKDYLTKCLYYIAYVIRENSGTEEREKAIKAFCHNIRSCVSPFLMTEEVTSLALEISKNYPRSNTDILSSLAHILKYDRKRLPDEIVKKIEKTIEQILGNFSQDLDSEFVTFISGESYKIDDLFQTDQNTDYQKSQQLLAEKSEQIAKKYLSDRDKLMNSLEFFITGKHKNLNIFAKTIGREFKDERVLINQCFDIYKNHPTSDPVFMGAVLWGVSENEPDLVEDVLDEICQHPSLGQHIVYLICYCTKLSKRSLDRILKALRNSVIKPSDLDAFNFGGVLAHLSPELIKDFVQELLETKLERISAISLSIIFSYTWGNKAKLGNFTDIIKNNFLSESGLLQVSQSSNLHGDFFSLDEVLEHLIQNSSDYDGLELAKLFLNGIVSLYSHRSLGTRVQSDHHVKKLINFIFKKYANDLWPTTLDLIIESDPLRLFFLQELLGHISNDYDDGNRVDPISNIPWNTIKSSLDKLDQIKKNKLQTFLIDSVNLLEKRDDQFVWHEWVRNLIDNYPDKPLLQSIESSIHSYSCWGGTSNYYKKYIGSLESLKSHSDTLVRHWASKCLESLKKDIDKEKIREEEMYLRH